LDSLDKQDMET